MSFIADLHTHSHLSRATSRQCTLEGFHHWAQLKGVRVVGTGDFTHPAWLAELSKKLVQSGPGLFRLCPEIAASVDKQIPQSCRSPVDFMITGEISSIYKRDGRTRKVHTLILVPDLATAETISARLDALGNVKSDGRPILGLDPRVLLEIAMEANPDAYMIPAHIWTPWFSMLGSKSGFDSTAECFGDLSEHIFAAETGLSSDPPMNWRVSSLDSLCLVSNSDSHSPGNLGRNGNIFHCEPDFYVMKQALRTKNPNQFGGTIDMFPEEGKYHLDGHRKCEVCMEPEESMAHDCLCPVCGKPLVLGVLHRVVELADRPKGGKSPWAMPCQYIIPLPEILSEIYACGPATKKVTSVYHRLIRKLGPEFKILRELDTELLSQTEPPLLDQAIQRLRKQEVIRKPGFDGEYGVIRVFADGEKDKLLNQGLFVNMPEPEKPVADRSKKRRLKKTSAGLREAPAPEYASPSPMAAAQRRQRARPDNRTSPERAYSADRPSPAIAGFATAGARLLAAKAGLRPASRACYMQPALWKVSPTSRDRRPLQLTRRLSLLPGPAPEKRKHSRTASLFLFQNSTSIPDKFSP